MDGLSYKYGHQLHMRIFVYLMIFILNSVPLMMGYVTRYVQGTDKLRRNGFEVHGMNDLNSTIIHCDNVKSLSEWVKLISENISNLSEIQVYLPN